MVSIYEMDKYLKENLIPNRYNHTKGVVATALVLAEIYKVDKLKAEIAALAHDIAKNMSIYDLKKIIDDERIVLSLDEENSKELWHSIVAPVLGRKIFKIDDHEILDAMRWHTTGKANMNDLEKIIYLADMIEPSRSFKGVNKLRDLAKKDLDLAVLDALSHTIKYLLDKGFAIDSNTIIARNYLLYNKKI